MKLPEFVTIGPFTIEIVLCPHDIMYEVSEAQGAFVVKPPYKIYLDKNMMDTGGPDAVNVLLHEFLHVGYYQYQLKEKEEEIHRQEPLAKVPLIAFRFFSQIWP